MQSVFRYATTLGLAALFAACGAASTGDIPADDGTSHRGGATAGSGTPTSDQDAAASTPSDSGAALTDASTTHDAGSPPPPHADSGPPGPQPDASASPDSAPPSSGDGTPTRQPCTGNFGNALTTTHGRLDGYLVSIVNVGGSSSCNGDSSHVHLQVLMKNSVYDVAVNVDTLIAERDIPIPDGVWSEGWHTSDPLDYAQLGLHSSDFKQPASQSALAQQIESELANVNHISVFATGYGPTGAHLVHRNGGGNDGAIVAQPLSGQAHLMMFTFTSSASF